MLKTNLFDSIRHYSIRLLIYQNYCSNIQQFGWNASSILFALNLFIAKIWKHSQQLMDFGDFHVEQILGC